MSSPCHRAHLRSANAPHLTSITFSEWRGFALGVRVDGGDEQLLPWPPYETTIPAGTKNIEVTVYGHRRNVCGPFYAQEGKWPVGTGSVELEAAPTSPDQPRALVPVGLMKCEIRGG